jgi:hypothetical protein
MRRKPANGARSKLVLDVPAELDTILKRHREVSWVRVAEKALWSYARKLELADRLVSRSAVTAGDAEALGREVKKGLRRRYRAASPA